MTNIFISGGDLCSVRLFNNIHVASVTSMVEEGEQDKPCFLLVRLLKQIRAQDIAEKEDI